MNSVGQAVDWLVALISGPLAGVLLTLAIAFVAFELLSGRMAMRRGLSVLIGGFILVGAFDIAQTLISVIPERPTLRTPPAATVPIRDDYPRTFSPDGAPPKPEPAHNNPFDPYAGGQPVN
ncbi:TrbC/VirB2 family protein [Erythrobacter sp. THAF29]|uniref:TrbC/VirB2 family protein n=1 Tax=Erythrobacter sp. THAF29 TaxID=2587851 RepID=UPI0015627AE1